MPLSKQLEILVSNARLLVLLPLVFLLATPLAALSVDSPALVLFVDANSGDDANDGISEKTPLRSLHAAQFKMDEIPDGEEVTLNLARGSEWRESYDWETHGRKRYPYSAFGKKSLTICAYGEGDKPTISGLDPMPNDAFQQHDVELYPNVWSQRLTPPSSYFIRYHDNYGAHPGVLIDRESLLAYVYLPPQEGQVMRDQKPLEGIDTEEDALAFVNENVGSFYARHNEDRTVDYFINSGSDPTKDGKRYEYRVRGDFFIGDDNTWEGIRFLGNSNRNGLGGQLRRVKDVEFLHGFTHNMLIGEGHFEDVLSAGAPRQDLGLARYFGVTGTAFHTHQADSRGIIYDRCIARNVTIAFFDHKADANRPAAVLRDCITENVRTAFAHAKCTQKFYVVGHQHRNSDGGAYGEFSIGGVENFIEDSTFRVSFNAGWNGHKINTHFRMRNSVVYMVAGEQAFVAPNGADYEYDNVTLVLDFEGKEVNPQTALLAKFAREGDNAPAPKVTFRNCVIAVINVPNAETAPGGSGIPMQFIASNEEAAGLRFENCVVTYMEGIPDSAGTEGEGYVFAAAEDIFAGDPEREIMRSSPAARLPLGTRVMWPDANRSSVRSRTRSLPRCHSTKSPIDKKKSPFLCPRDFQCEMSSGKSGPSRSLASIGGAAVGCVPRSWFFVL